MADHVINSCCSITASKNSSVSLNESKDIDNKKSYFRAAKEYLAARKLQILAYPLSIILLSVAGGAAAIALLLAVGVILGPVVAVPTLIITAKVIGGLIFGLGVLGAVDDWLASVECAQIQGEKKLTAELNKFKKIESSYKDKINISNDEIQTFLNDRDKEIKKPPGSYCDHKVIQINMQVKKNRAKIRQLSHNVKDNEKEIEFINTALSKLAEQKNNGKKDTTENKLYPSIIV